MSKTAIEFHGIYLNKNESRRRLKIGKRSKNDSNIWANEFGNDYIVQNNSKALLTNKLNALEETVAHCGNLIKLGSSART